MSSKPRQEWVRGWARGGEGRRRAKGTGARVRETATEGHGVEQPSAPLDGAWGNGAGAGGRQVGETSSPPPSFDFARCAGGASTSRRGRQAPCPPPAQWAGVEWKE